MSKVPLLPVASIDNSLINNINTNSNTITTAFDNTISRNGQSPNQMQATLDMNSNPIINVPFASTLNQPVVLGQVTPNTTFIPVLSGDVSSGSFNGTTLPVTLDTVNSNVGTFGGANAIPVVTENAKGLTTAVSTVQPNPTQVNNVSFPSSAASGTLPVASGLNTITYTTTLPATNFPALTGSVTTSAGSLSTALASGAVGFSNINSSALATTSQYLSDTSSLVLQSDQVWGAAGWVTTTYSATVSLNFNTFINTIMIFGTGNITFSNPTNVKAGQIGIIQLVQDSVGSRTASWGGDFHFPGGTAPTLSTAPNAIDLLVYVALSTTYISIILLAKGT